MTRYKRTYVESERGWGRKYETYFSETYEDAWNSVRSNLDNNPPGPAPDYYFLIQKVEEEVDSPIGGISYIDVTKHFFDRYRNNKVDSATKRDSVTP